MGLGDNNNTMVVTMENWNNVLYAGIGNVIAGARIYRSIDGTTWTKVNNDGFGHVKLNTIIDFAPFGGSLFATTNEDGPGPTQAAEIWKSADGINWLQSGADGLGHAHNTGFYNLVEFNGQLYTGSRNTTDGGEMYRSADGNNWNLIANTAGGFGDANNEIIWGLASFGGFIWAGTSNNNGAQVWRSADGTNWFKYFDYAAVVPPMPDFTAVNTIDNFVGHLYWFAVNGTNGGEILKRHTEGGEWLEASVQGLGDVNNIWFSEDVVIAGSLAYFGTRNAVTGGELWYSADGINATQINTDGFGNVDNFAIYALAFKNYLYVGLTSGNPAKGCEIWRRLITSDFGIANKKLPTGTQGQSYLEQLETNGGTKPYSYRIVKGNLPKGLELTASGEIKGTPEVAGDFNFVIEVKDSFKKVSTAQRLFSLKIEAGTINQSVEGISTSTDGIDILPKTGADLY